MVATGVLHVVGSLPPIVDGIRDYGVRLADGLQSFGIESSFLAKEGRDPMAARQISGFAGHSLRRPNGRELARELAACQTNAVLLHHAGYAYAPRGAPFWLAHGLQRWKANNRRRRLVIMFHDLWASGPIWRSSFWMSPLQRGVVLALVYLADAFLTNSELHAKQLRRLAPGRRPIDVLPVFSNIGEPDELPLLESRDPVAVVFGQRGTRERVYAHIEDFLPILCSVGIEGILDVGPPADDRLIARVPLAVTRCGYLDAASASTIMLGARVGLIDYPLHCAGKSGTFAAYTAHGLVPLIRSAVGGRPDGLCHGVNLARTGEPLPGLREAAQGLATAAHLWYREHALERAAARFAEALRSVGGIP